MAFPQQNPVKEKKKMAKVLFLHRSKTLELPLSWVETGSHTRCYQSIDLNKTVNGLFLFLNL